MLWIFDSGFGGYKTLKYLKNKFPDFDYIFYADNKNVPYGNKSPEEIEKLTFDGLNYLFDNGAKLVILACNTASAYAIRKWQTLYPEKKVLSITIPGVEKIIEKWYQKVAILATLATVNSDIYSKKYKELTWKEIDFIQIPAPDIVKIIENQIDDGEIIQNIIKSYLDQIDEQVDALVLWCTHFPIYKKYFQKFFSKDIIDPSYESVEKLVEYFRKHSDIYKSISKNWKTKIIQTWENKIWNIF